MRRRRRLLKELDQDMRDHLEMETQDNIDRGMSPEEARFAALRKFGNPTRIKEETREVWVSVWLEQLLQDVRFGIRTLWHSPGLTVSAILAIALGIGVNVGVFSVLNGVALRLLPIARPEQIVSVNQILHGRFTRNVHNGPNMFSYSEYLDYRDHNQVFSGLVAYEPDVEATLSGRHAGQISGTAASCNYFSVLGERTAQGRSFVDSDCAARGGNAVVVVSDDLWRGRFAADPSLVGKTITLNRSPYTVIGIARPGFTGTEIIPSAFWAPITMQKTLEPGDSRMADNNMSWLALLGRMRPDVKMQQVRADLAVIAGRIDHQQSGRSTTLAIQTATFLASPEERSYLVPIASTILVAFALVLVIACANVASLLLARAFVRQKEIALRLSIGATRWRLVRQLLTESLLLSLAGGVLGSLLAFWSFRKIISYVMSHLPHDLPAITLNVSPNLHVFVYALLLTVITGVAFGLIPALQGSRLDLNTTMKGDNPSFNTLKRSGRLMLSILVGSQVAVCMVLLLAAGLLLRGLYYAQTINPGFEESNVAQQFFDLRAQGCDDARATAFIERLKEKIRGIPGVLEVAQADSAPLSHDFSGDSFAVPGGPEKVSIEFNHVSADYFSLIGIPIVRGRGFTSGAAHDEPGVVVSESTARRVWPGQDPLGKTLKSQLTGREHVVIGVAKDAQVSHLGELNTSYLYLPAGADDNSRTYLLVRYGTRFADIANGIRDAAQSLDPDVPVDVIKLEDNLEVWRAPSRIVAALSGCLGALALLLATIGVYATVSYSVGRSVREIGIRMALGANGRNVIRHVLWQAMRPVLIGTVVGVGLCAAVSSVLSGMMFGLSVHDPIAFLSVPLFLVLVGLLASYLPARRAMHVDPMVVLRCE